MIERLTKGVAPSLLDTDKANEIIDAINAILNSKGENGIEVKYTQAGGLTISKKNEKISNKKFDPFEIMSITEDFIAVNPGTINNELVTPVGGIDFNSSNDTRYLCIEVKFSDDSNIDSAELVIEDNAPDGFDFSENQAPGDCKILIATITDLSFFQVRSGNMTISPQEMYSIPKDSVSVGEYDHNIYYSWSVTTS